MINIIVHIHNRINYMDKRVFVKIEMPYVPRVGEFLALGHDLIDELENQIKLDKDLESIYKTSLEDCICVVGVCYIHPKKEIHIELYHNHDIIND